MVSDLRIQIICTTNIHLYHIQKMEEKIKDYFKRYPNSKEVFENGGHLFHTRGAADSFGKGETKKYPRPSVKSTTAESENLDDSEADRLAQEVAKKAQLKAEAVLKIANTEDLSTIPYQEQVKLIKALELETENQKGETILKALSEYKETLKDE